MPPQPQSPIHLTLVSCKVTSPQSRDPNLYRGAVALDFEAATYKPFLLLSVKDEPPADNVLDTDERCDASGTLRRGRIVLNTPNSAIAVDSVTVFNHGTG